MSEQKKEAAAQEQEAVTPQEQEAAVPSAKPRRHYGYRVVAGIFVLALVLGVFLFRNMKRSIRTIEQTQKDMAIAGKTLTWSGCMDRVMKWNKMCGAMQVLCRASISRITASCLEARSRTKACKAMDLGKSRAHFTFKHCKARGEHRRRHWKRECGTAFGTLHKYCQFWKNKKKRGAVANRVVSVRKPSSPAVSAKVPTSPRPAPARR